MEDACLKVDTGKTRACKFLDLLGTFLASQSLKMIHPMLAPENTLEDI